jgi:hypothetical protein
VIQIGVLYTNILTCKSKLLIPSNIQYTKLSAMKYISCYTHVVSHMQTLNSSIYGTIETTPRNSPLYIPYITPSLYSFYKDRNTLHTQTYLITNLYFLVLLTKPVKLQCTDHRLFNGPLESLICGATSGCDGVTCSRHSGCVLYASFFYVQDELCMTNVKIQWRAIQVSHILEKIGGKVLCGV